MRKLFSSSWLVLGTQRLKKTGVTTRIVVPVLVAVLLSTLLISTTSAKGNHGGIVDSIDNAPIVPDGTTTGSATDFVITLDTSLDPSVPGRSLAAGSTIRITLPASFVNTGGLPFEGVGSSATCAPGNLICNTGVLLQGWPQHPIGPPFAKYDLTLDGNTIVFTALENLGPAGIVAPGIKQIHLVLNGYINPKPGNYKIEVEAETGPGGSVEKGTGNLRILEKSRASINHTSAFVAGTPNRIYQATTVDQPIPMPYDFLLWDTNGDPFVGVEIVPAGGGEGSKSIAALIVQDGKTVGHVRVKAPKHAKGHSVFSTGPSTLIDSPISNAPTGRMTVSFLAGSATGTYKLTFSLEGGNSVETFVTVN